MHKIAVFFAFLLVAAVSNAATPRLNFTDLVNGPDTGIGDGLGSGTIVTVWGNYLGANQASSKIRFRDSTGTVRDCAHVYYWKNADGSLPGGPSNLYESHAMQEIACSIPDGADGDGEIFVEVEGIQSNALPFKVRAGNILHVKPNGSCSSSTTGSFNNPYCSKLSTRDGSNTVVTNNDHGDVVYLHDGVSVSDDNNKSGFYDNKSWNPNDDADTAFVAYPNSEVVIEGSERGIDHWDSSARRGANHVISKLSVFGGAFPDASDYSSRQAYCSNSCSAWGIEGTKDGRIVGNYISEIPGRCSDGSQGAIVSDNPGADIDVYGNEIDSWGCARTSKFEHTTYFATNSSNDTVGAWDLGWNYLHDNEAIYGLHMFEQADCGDINDTVLIHDNVVINQKGSGINVAVGSVSGADEICWSNDFHIYNNVIINAGAYPYTLNSPQTVAGGSSDCLRVNDQGLSGTFVIEHNICLDWKRGEGFSLDGPDNFATVVMNNNVFQTSEGRPFYGCDRFAPPACNEKTKIQGTNNIWFSTDGNPGTIPHWDSNPITTDPELSSSTARIILGAESAVINAASPGVLAITHDIYQNAQSPTVVHVGAVGVGAKIPKAPLLQLATN